MQLATGQVSELCDITKRTQASRLLKTRLLFRARTFLSLCSCLTMKSLEETSKCGYFLHGAHSIKPELLPRS